MFAKNQIFNVYEKNVVYQNKFRVKTNFDSQFNENIMVLFKTDGTTLTKYFIESYMIYNNSLRKLHFIIDLEKVDQIDLRQNDNMILLRQANEYCKLQTESKATLKSWMKILCQNCGFSNIYGKKKASQSSPLKENKNMPLKNSHSNELTCQLNKNVGFINNSNSQNPIAGILATSVGSINAKLDHIFKDKIQYSNQISYLNSSIDENVNPDSYVNLEECQSGTSNTHKKTRYSKKQYESFNSLDEEGYANIIKTDSSDSSVFENMDEKTLFKSKISAGFIGSLENINSDRNFNLVPKPLMYVPLEVVYNASSQSSTDKPGSIVSNNNDETFKRSKTSTVNFVQNEQMFYTDWDKIRSEALKNVLGKTAKLF